MGYAKGSISLSPSQDIPMLLQVLHAQFITHDQLRDFGLLPEIRVAVDTLEPATNLVKARIAAVEKLFNLSILDVALRLSNSVSTKFIMDWES